MLGSSKMSDPPTHSSPKIVALKSKGQDIQKFQVNTPCRVLQAAGQELHVLVLGICPSAVARQKCIQSPNNHVRQRRKQSSLPKNNHVHQRLKRVSSRVLSNNRSCKNCKQSRVPSSNYQQSRLQADKTSLTVMSLTRTVSSDLCHRCSIHREGKPCSGNI
jgi:hypothetical protein